MLATLIIALTVATTSPDDALAVSLYGSVVSSASNGVIAPASIKGALAVVALGASGSTAKDLAKLTGSSSASGTTRILTNVSLSPAFVSEATAKFHATFAPQPAGAADAITIENAVHFKGAWKIAFDKGATRDEPFVTASTGASKGTGAQAPLPVPMMHLSSRSLRAAHGRDFDVVELGYQDGSTFTLVVPSKSDGLALVEKSLARALATKLRAQPVELSLPRFHASASQDIGAALKHAGLTHAFCGDAGVDFSKLAKEPVCINAVDHDASVDVDEAGTVAEAVTRIHMAKEGEPEGPGPLEIRADHPFLFAIRDASGALAFIGHVVAP
ncbi:MAG TPA: serpin family protein [Myxococcota bacterium]|jgi:serine protease inhibitor